MPLSIRAVPCLSDNYIWLLRDEASGAVALCDPGEAGPAAAALREGGGRLDLILLTHTVAEGRMNEVIAQMQGLPTVLAPITRIRKEELA